MSELLSHRVKNAREVVLVPASLENVLPKGTYYWGFLCLAGAILAFFGGLVVAFLWRAQSKQYWVPIALPGELWLSTGLLAVSSLTCEWARGAGRRLAIPSYRRWLALTLLAGGAFVASQVSAWWKLVQQGVYAVENPHASFFYIFTGLHAGHLVFGLGGLGILLYRAYQKNPTPRRREWLNVVVFYWHFLGVLWLALFVILLRVK
jgi:cytochrome c oxidase subunit 3